MSTSPLNPANGSDKGTRTAARRRILPGAEIPAQLLSIHDAGRFLGVGHKLIRQLIACGELPYIQIHGAGSKYLLDVDDLRAWIMHNKRKAC